MGRLQQSIKESPKGLIPKVAIIVELNVQSSLLHVFISKCLRRVHLRMRNYITVKEMGKLKSLISILVFMSFYHITVV
jgi:hypothetical protein